jgi:transposase
LAREKQVSICRRMLYKSWPAAASDNPRVPRAPRESLSSTRRVSAGRRSRPSERGSVGSRHLRSHSQSALSGWLAHYGVVALPCRIQDPDREGKACPDCGRKLKPPGEYVSEILEYVPARFKVIRQVRPKLACALCERIVQTEAPSRPIERSVAGPGRLAHVLVSKYRDHLPLYRQSGDLRARRGGVGTLDAGGLGGRDKPAACAVGGSAAAPCDGGRQAARRRHADSGAGTRKCKNKNWTAMGLCARGPSTPAAGHGSRTRRIARASIRGRPSAILQARCRQMVTRDSIRCTKQGAFRKRPAGRTCAESLTTCTSHTNRCSRPKPWNSSPRSKKEIRGHPAKDRREVRNACARPLLESLKQWLEETLGKLSRKSDTAMAVRYALGHPQIHKRVLQLGPAEPAAGMIGLSHCFS